MSIISDIARNVSGSFFKQVKVFTADDIKQRQIFWRKVFDATKNPQYTKDNGEVIDLLVNEMPTNREDPEFSAYQKNSIYSTVSGFLGLGNLYNSNPNEFIKKANENFDKMSKNQIVALSYYIKNRGFEKTIDETKRMMQSLRPSSDEVEFWKNLIGSLAGSKFKEKYSKEIEMITDGNNDNGEIPKCYKDMVYRVFCDAKGWGQDWKEPFKAKFFAKANSNFDNLTLLQKRKLYDDAINIKSCSEILAGDTKDALSIEEILIKKIRDRDKLRPDGKAPRRITLEPTSPDSVARYYLFGNGFPFGTALTEAAYIPTSKDSFIYISEDFDNAKNAKNETLHKWYYVYPLILYPTFWTAREVFPVINEVDVIASANTPLNFDPDNPGYKFNLGGVKGASVDFGTHLGDTFNRTGKWRFMQFYVGGIFDYKSYSANTTKGITPGGGDATKGIMGQGGVPIGTDTNWTFMTQLMWPTLVPYGIIDGMGIEYAYKNISNERKYPNPYAPEYIGQSHTASWFYSLSGIEGISKSKYRDLFDWFFKLTYSKNYGTETRKKTDAGNIQYAMKEDMWRFDLDAVPDIELSKTNRDSRLLLKFNAHFGTGSYQIKMKSKDGVLVGSSPYGEDEQISLSSRAYDWQISPTHLYGASIEFGLRKVLNETWSAGGDPSLKLGWSMLTKDGYQESQIFTVGLKGLYFARAGVEFSVYQNPIQQLKATNPQNNTAYEIAISFNPDLAALVSPYGYSPLVMAELDIRMFWRWDRYENYAGLMAVGRFGQSGGPRYRDDLNNSRENNRAIYDVNRAGYQEYNQRSLLNAAKQSFEAK